MPQTQPPPAPASVADPRAVPGPLVVAVMLAAAAALTGLAAYYHFQAGRQAVEFWGPEKLQQIRASKQVMLYELEPLATPGSVRPKPADPTAPSQRIAGLPIATTWELTDAPGLVHFRYIFTQDGNFLWDERRLEPLDQRRWRLALQFSSTSASSDSPDPLILLLNEQADVMGRPAAPGDKVEAIPCPRLAGPIQTYLNAVHEQPPAAAAEADLENQPNAPPEG